MKVQKCCHAFNSFKDFSLILPLLNNFAIGTREKKYLLENYNLILNKFFSTTIAWLKLTSLDYLYLQRLEVFTLILSKA